MRGLPSRGSEQADTDRRIRRGKPKTSRQEKESVAVGGGMNHACDAAQAGDLFQMLMRTTPLRTYIFVRAHTNRFFI